MFVCFLRRCDPTRVMASSFLMFLDHTQRRSTVGRSPLDEWSARRRDLYLKTHDTHNRQTSMHAVGFEPTISAGERPQTYALDRAAAGTGNASVYTSKSRKIFEVIAYNEMQGNILCSMWTTRVYLQFVSPLLLLLWMNYYVQWIKVKTSYRALGINILLPY